jgi:presenilin-like A22 family membrane protease
VGLVLGLNFQFWYAILIFGAVAVYDYVAVFRTREMTALANTVSSNNLSFLISVADLESVPKQGLSDAEVASYMKYLSDSHEVDDPRFKRILKSGRLPVMSQVSLGEGDLCLPLMAAVSAYVTFGSVMLAIVLLGAVMGIVATMAMLKMYKHPIPAIPPLFAFVCLPAGIALLRAGAGSSAYLWAAILVIVSALVLFIDMVTVVSRMRRGGAHAPRGRKGRKRHG